MNEAMTIEEAQRRREGKRLVLTNGVFDILHAGHVQYLEQARELGDMLIVGVNSDASVKQLNKGDNRPFNSQEDRQIVLQALSSVDGVVIFEERTPEALVSKLQPEIFVKGGDYRIEDLPEAALVRSYGGEVVLLPFLEGRSTTSVLKKLGIE